MQNNSKFYLHFQVQGDGTEWMDAYLPTPNYFYRFNTIVGNSTDSYCIAYLIDGVFGTEKGRRYLNDIVARFILTLPIKQRLMYPPPSDALQHDKTYKLKHFQNLKSKAKEIKREIGINADWVDSLLAFNIFSRSVPKLKVFCQATKSCRPSYIPRSGKQLILR